MSGSDGGLEHAGKMARYLYDNGIPVMALGYIRRNVPENARKCEKNV